MDNNDIKKLLYKIKQNIKIIENGKYSQKYLEEIENDFLKLLEFIKLFLISERDTYYGYFLINLQFRVNFYSESIAGIKLDEYPLVFEANPLLLCEFSLKEIIYIVCHEIDHIIFNHPTEMVKSNPERDEEIFLKFNYAADAAVNDRINNEIVVEKRKFMKKPNGIITSKVLAQKFGLRKIRSLENYKYYFNLIKDKENKDKSSNGQNSIMQEKKSDSEGNKVGTKGLPINDQENNGEKELVTASKSIGRLKDHQWNVDNDIENTSAIIKEFINSSVSMMNEEARGMMPKHFWSEVKKVNQPPVLLWQNILKKYVGTIAVNKRKTRTRLNRRQPERFDISGRVDERVLKIVIAIDTSASVENNMIKKILNEVFDIVAKRKHEITIIECDAEVQRVYKVKTIGDIKNKIVGRGGTLFEPVIEYINDDKYYRDAILIYFTDGYGEEKISRPRTYRNLWVVLEDAKNLSVKNPYGLVLTL